MTAGKQRNWCDTCTFAEITKTEYEYFTETHIFCKKINREIDLLTCDQPHWFFDVGCASHSDLQVLDKIKRSSFEFSKKYVFVPKEVLGGEG